MWGRSCMERNFGKICSPAASSRKEALRYWLGPLMAPMKERNSPRARSGVKATGALRVVRRRAPRRARARSPGDAPDAHGVLQVLRIARQRVPVVTLHVIAVLGDERGAHRVTGGGIAGEEAERVAVDAGVALRVDRRTLGVGDPRIHRQSRRLARARQLDGPLRREVPGVIKIQVGNVARQGFGLDQPGVGILGRVARDGAGLLHRLAHRRRGQVRGARRALALAEVHRDTQAAVALVLDGVDFAQPHAHREPLAHRDVGLALRCALPARLLESEAGDFGERRYGLRRLRWGHRA